MPIMTETDAVSFSDSFTENEYRVGMPVELSISCRDLVDMDVFSKSDPMCVVYIQPFGQRKWQEKKRTEIIWNNLNPEFATKVNLMYHFEELQKMRFEVFDADSSSPDLRNHDFIGQMECTLGQIVCSGGVTGTLVGGPREKNGTITVSAEELISCKDEVELQFLGKKLDRKDFFGKSDPFLSLLKSNENGSFTVVHRTEYRKRTLDPVWKRFTIPMRNLCNGDYDRSIRVECYDWNLSGSHSFIGKFNVTLRQLAKGPGPETVFSLINPEKQKKKDYRNSGFIHLIHIEIRPLRSFLDYVRGGTELACTIAIDFTASNGDPSSPDSLHYISPQQVPNQYETALMAIGEIIEDYDSDKLFPVLGFGARLPDATVSHEFYVNGHSSNPYCEKLEGVLQAYKHCLRRIQLYGPTNFAPVINHVARNAAAVVDGSQYFILLILTDGVITDMPQTKQAIVNASVLPLSVVIVGVGNAAFDAMEELDGDEMRVSYGGKYAARDIVQFVPFRDFLAGTWESSKWRLAKEVLAEIPDQFLSYMNSKGINPKPALLNVAVPPEPEAD